MFQKLEYPTDVLFVLSAWDPKKNEIFKVCPIANDEEANRIKKELPAELFNYVTLKSGKLKDYITDKVKLDSITSIVDRYTFAERVIYNSGERLPEKKIHTCELSVGKHNKWFLECLSNVAPSVYIVAGEAHTRVYNVEARQLLFKSIKAFVGSDAEMWRKPHLVSGPVIMTDLKDKEKNWKNRVEGSIITQIAKYSGAVVFLSDRRQREHFRFGHLNVYAEDEHQVSASTRKSFFYSYDYLTTYKYMEKFVKILSCKDTKVSEDPENDFIFLTEEEIRDLKDKIESKNLVYEDCSKDQIKEIVDEELHISLD